MSTRLTKTMRSEICTHVITKTFESRIKSAKEEKAKLADLAYADFVPVEFINLAKKHPQDWFVCHSSIDAAGFRFPIDGGYRMQMSGVNPFPASNGARYNPPDVTIINDDLRQKVRAHIAVEQAIVDEKAALKNRIEGLLNAVNTLEKLRELAPELADYFPEPEQKGGLPMIPVGALVTDLMAAGLKIPK